MPCSMAVMSPELRRVWLLITAGFGRAARQVQAPQRGLQAAALSGRLPAGRCPQRLDFRGVTVARQGQSAGDLPGGAAFAAEDAGDVGGGNVRLLGELAERFDARALEA